MTGVLSPALALSAVLSTAYAALFHLLQRGDLPALKRYLLAAWLGFGAGHLSANAAGVRWFQVGHLNVLSGTAGVVLALLIAKSLEA